MQTYPKKRLSIVIEAPALKRLIQALEKQNVPGYTVIPAMAGKGQHGDWNADGLTSTAGRMVQVLTVVDEVKIEGILTAVRKVLDHQMGIVTMADVQVLRPEHF